MEILRFEELENGVLLGKVDPEADVLTLMAPHFADRFPMENWMIYDRRRKKAVVHPKRKSWYLVEEIPEEVLDSQQRSAAEQEMDTLWKCCLLYTSNTFSPSAVGNSRFTLIRSAR